MSYKEKLKNIKAFVFDVDGVFTDGSVYLMPDMSMCRTMNVLDGYAVVKARKHNYPICATCPQNAVPEVKAVAEYISPVPGGKGAVRDVIEQVMKIHGTWQEDDHTRSV